MAREKGEKANVKGVVEEDCSVILIPSDQLYKLRKNQPNWNLFISIKIAYTRPIDFSSNQIKTTVILLFFYIEFLWIYLLTIINRTPQSIQAGSVRKDKKMSYFMEIKENKTNDPTHEIKTAGLYFKPVFSA